METRKIQTVGGGTYTVSLPKEWAEGEGITAGEDVNVHTHIDGLLVVQAQERVDDATVRVTVQGDRDDPEYLERTLRAAYSAGITELVLDAEDAFTSDQRRTIDRVCRNLAGVTVVENAADQVTVRTLLDAAEVSVRQSVRQLQFVALSMHRDAIATLTDGATADRQTERDDQADRLHAMIDRNFTRGLSRLEAIDALGVTRPELFELWVTTRELERVADHAEDIVTIAARRETPITGSTATDLRALAGTAREIVEDGVSVVVGDADVETARQALNARDEVREETDDLERRLFKSSAEDYRLTRALDSVRRTAEHGGNIAELGVQASIRRGTPQESSVEREETDDSDQRFDAYTDDHANQC